MQDVLQANPLQETTRMAVTQLESLYEDYNKIYALTFSGRFVDRRMLVDLDESTWASVSKSARTKVYKWIRNGTQYYSCK